MGYPLCQVIVFPASLSSPKIYWRCHVEFSEMVYTEVL